MTSAGAAAGVAGVVGVLGAAVTGIAAACCSVLVCCAGAWVFLGPVNYFGCGTERPDGVAEADLIGTYETRDGARLELQAGGSLVATALATEFMGGSLNLSGPGEWSLQSAGGSQGDITLRLTSDGRPRSHHTYLDISGTRERPWLYWYDGDPDVCELYRFDRIA
ncbi:hypothetical protein ACQP1P_26970 [Dactylosporangium sp. CA-052675]|uniref:hypothetical protein n=1 Tax=Dactylosporangium sp. CA-052675 TaxID=3239927 RepID=UPI003D8AD09F